MYIFIHLLKYQQIHDLKNNKKKKQKDVDDNDEYMYMCVLGEIIINVFSSFPFFLKSQIRHTRRISHEYLITHTHSQHTAHDDDSTTRFCFLLLQSSNLLVFICFYVYCSCFNFIFQRTCYCFSPLFCFFLRASSSCVFVYVFK